MSAGDAEAKIERSRTGVEDQGCTEKIGIIEQVAALHHVQKRHEEQEGNSQSDGNHQGSSVCRRLLLDSCTRPDLITEITLQPLRRYDVDAAILFSDIVVPLRAIGIDVDIKAGIGYLDNLVAPSRNDLSGLGSPFCS